MHVAAVGGASRRSGSAVEWHGTFEQTFPFFSALAGDNEILSLRLTGRIEPVNPGYINVVTITSEPTL